jgi:cyclopropane fatty-acyl-phospholipid synthase-like methyltransferase
MADIQTKAAFEEFYARKPPWDIDRPQRVFIDNAGRIIGDVLDIGCGTGENSLFFASLGRNVTGADFLSMVIDRARQKAAERKLKASFRVMDALDLKQCKDRFDNIIDCGLFHVFSDENRPRYVEGLATVLKPGGRVFLLCFSDQEPGDHGPRRVSKKELESSFSSGWEVESIDPCRIEVRPDFKEMTFSEGGPKAWFAVVKRTG